MGDSPQDPVPGRRVPDLDVPLVGPGHFGILFAVIAAFGLYLTLTLLPDCDVVLMLHYAGLVFDGARLYVDVMEVNPPLIIYLHLPVVAASRVIGVPPPALFPVFLYALILCSLALCYRLRSSLPVGLGQAAILLLASALLVFAGGLSGQREHLMLTLILPYAFAAAIISDGGKVPRSLGCLTGVMAGVGFAIKPYFVPAFLAVELYLAARRGPRVWGRAQALAVWAVFLTYAAAVLGLTPGYLPFAWSLRDIYRDYHPFGEDYFWRFSWAAWLLALSVALAIGLVRRRAKGWSDVFCLLALLLTASVYVQAKGFLYHWYPVLALALVLLGVSATAFALGFSRPKWWTGPEAALALLVPASCSLGVLFWSIANSADRDIEVERAVREHGRGGSVYAMSCTTHALCIAGRSGVGWATNNYSMLPIQAYYDASGWRPGEYHAWDRMPEGERRFLSEVVAKLERERPALLLVDKVPPSPEMAGFDFLDYCQQEPRFPHFLAGYRYLREFRRYRVYELDPTHADGRAKVAGLH